MNQEMKGKNLARQERGCMRAVMKREVERREERNIGR